MTHWSLIMALVLMVFGGSSSVAQDETEEHENVVFDYLILPPMEDDPGGSAKPRPKKIFQLLPVNSENAKNMMSLDANAMKQAPQSSYINIEAARNPHHNPAAAAAAVAAAARHPNRNPDPARRMHNSPAPPRQSQRIPDSARHSQRDPQHTRHSHYSPEANPQSRHNSHENVPQAKYKTDRSRHRHHDPNSPRHAHHKLKTTQNPYVTETPRIPYHSVEKIRIADPNPIINNPEIIDNSFVPEKTGIPYLDSDSITGNPYVKPEINASPYNPEIKINNYGNPEVTMNIYKDPEVSALPYVHPDITASNYAAGEISIKPYNVDLYRESEISPSAYKIQPGTEDTYYAPEVTEASTRRHERTEPYEASGSRRKYKYYGKPEVDPNDFDNNTYGPSTGLHDSVHYHQLPPVEKRDDYFASYDREYSTHSFKETIATTPGKPVLECYSCYSSAKTTRACIEPTKHGVGVLPCKDPREVCYSTFLKTGSYYLSIQRGCMLECHDSIVTECCRENRCNYKKPATALSGQRLANTPSEDGATQHGPPSILFFLTILLLLHTVVKVAYL